MVHHSETGAKWAHSQALLYSNRTGEQPTKREHMVGAFGV